MNFDLPSTKFAEMESSLEVKVIYGENSKVQKRIISTIPEHAMNPISLIIYKTIITVNKMYYFNMFLY